MNILRAWWCRWLGHSWVFRGQGSRLDVYSCPGCLHRRTLYNPANWFPSN